MKNVHEMAKDLVERLPKLNFLVHSAGVFGISGLEETEEGIDKKLASRYYSRWALTYDLLPLLRKAKDVDEPASVLSILGAGFGAQVDLDNLGLKKNYSGIKAMMQSISYNDLMVAVSHP
jgi:NAD(P)-dependent dehydrogenase (short-subunit alcohol dehydrogenase family)